MSTKDSKTEQSCTLHSVSTSCDLGEIPFPLKRTITYIGQKMIKITLDTERIKRQMEYYCYNTGIRNNWC